MLSVDALVVDAECWRTVQLGATNVECRCCRVAPSDTERRSVMDKSAAVFSGSPLNAECDALGVDAECGALCGLMLLTQSAVFVVML